MISPFQLESAPTSRFQANEAAVGALRPLLASPAFTEALHAVEASIPLSGLPVQVPGVHHDTTIAHRFYWEQGARASLAALMSLARFRAPVEHQDQEQDFDHVTKDLTA